MAIHRTGRTAIVGFRHNHHGKSLAVQNITGVDADLPVLDSFHPLPFIPGCTEAEVLDHVDQLLRSVHPAAVFVEPMQGRGGGHEASPAFYEELQRRCAEREILVICDEIFCGGHRTGPFLLHRRLGLRPDIVLIGKAIANGFPAAGVLLADGWDIHPKDFRFSSTFSDNPLACAAVVGTLEEMERIDVEAAVTAIEAALRGIDVEPTQMRLRGAACFVDMPSDEAAASVHDHLFRERVLALRRGRTIGLWPPATIEPAHLHHVVHELNHALGPFR
jgi:acetylornithine/succinyldiaminopimelate/putrescine aminotransferase